MRTQVIASVAVAPLALLASEEQSNSATIGMYPQQCLAAGVPLPPKFDKPTGRPWKFVGEVPEDLVFASSLPTSEVWVYRTTGEPTPKSPAGVCIALPRLDEDKNIRLLGVICQATDKVQVGAETTPAIHACFWDNLKSNGTRWIYSDITKFNPSLFQGGDMLKENCTFCHRGDNAYIVIPKTPEATADKSHANRKGTPYVPIGQATWVNPPPTVKLSGGCDQCHDIPGLLSPSTVNPSVQSVYCSTVLKNFIQDKYPAGYAAASGLLMPPGGTDYDPAQLKDVQAIASACSKLGVDID